MNFYTKIYLFVFVLIGASCSSLDQNASASFSEEVTVITNGQTQRLEASKALSIGEDPIFVQRSVGQPMILIPINESVKNLEVSFPENISASAPLNYEQVDQEIGIIMSKILLSYDHIANKKYTSALEVLDSIPNSEKLTYLNLIKSSIYYTMGNKEKARLHLGLAEKKFPADENIIKFKAVLSE
jgi:ABC-type sugar transport system ATPase subunit